MLRKHGGTVAAVLAHAERCWAERDRLENAEVALKSRDVGPSGTECITPLPQIAALVETHFRIEKANSGKLAQATVERIENAGVVEELCRMLGAGSIDAGARRSCSRPEPR